MIVVCPNCKEGKSVSSSWFSQICNCGTYFNKETSLKVDEAVSMRNSSKTPNPKLMELREVSEQSALQFQERTRKQYATGNKRHHEPYGKKRDW